MRRVSRTPMFVLASMRKARSHPGTCLVMKRRSWSICWRASTEARVTSQAFVPSRPYTRVELTNSVPRSGKTPSNRM